MTSPSSPRTGITLGVLLAFLAIATTPAYGQTRLRADDGAFSDALGGSVAIDGEYAIAGAAGAYVALDPGFARDAGAAYVFRRNGSSWVEEAKLTASDAAAGDIFGADVAISGDYAIVGAFGDGDDGNRSGSAYVFRRSGSSWVEEAKLTASDAAAGDIFGASVAVSGDYAVVAARGDNDSRGAAYVFHRSGSSWVEEAKLTASDRAAGDLFGESVAISGDYVVSGAPGNDDLGSRSGAAYVFHRSGTSWVEEAKLLADDGVQGASLGNSVAISDDYVVAGRRDVSDLRAAAYVFRRDGTAWTQESKITGRDGGEGDNFGASVAASGDFFVVGAPNARGGAEASGLAYVYNLIPVLAAPSSLAFQETGVGSVRELSLSVRNVGLAPLVVTSVESTDGALFSASPSSFTVSEGGEQLVRVTFAPSAIGTFSGELEFLYNGDSSPYTVTLSGEASGAEISFSPRSLALSDTAPGESSTSTLTVSNPGLVTLEVSGVESTDGAFAASPSSFTVEPAGSASVTVTFTPTATGAFVGDLVFAHNGETTPDAVTVRGTGRGSEISFSAETVSFPATAPGESSTRTLTVSNPGLAALEVSGIESTETAFSASPASFTVAPGGRQEVSVTFVPSVAGEIVGDLVFVHNGETTPDTVAVSGIGRGAEVSFSSGLLAFAETGVGSASSLALTVENTGLAPLEVTGVESTDGAFSASAASFTVAPGESQEVSVTFAPAAAGEFTGDLVFTHNGVTTPDSVTVSGTARGGEIRFNRSTVGFNRTAPGESSTGALRVSNTGLAALEVSGIESTNGAFTASLTSFTVAPGANETVTVTFAPTATGAYEGDLVFTHNGVTSPDTVAVVGESDPTRLSFSPSALAFGTFDTGTSASSDLVLFRNGPATSVTVSSVYTSDAVFQVDVSTPFVVEGGVSVPVSFTPTYAGPFEGYVYFQHDGATDPDSVAVSGTGRFNARLSEIATSTVGTNFVNVVFRAADAGGRGLNIPAEVVDQDLDLFTLFENSQAVSPTAPETFYQVLKLDEVPYRIRTVLLLDNSTSVGNDLPEIRDAARTIVDNLTENQEVALYVFDSQVSLLQDFTSDAGRLRAAIDGISIGSPSTALYNGLTEGLDRWDDRFVFVDNGDGTVDIDIERGFLVLLSDGEDTSGGATLAEVLAARGGKRVYAVGYGDVNDSVLNQVGNAGVYTVDTADDLPGVFAQVQAEIENDAQSFYILNFSSPRRADQTWPLEICLRDNTYTGAGACAQTTYDSDGFSDPVRGVYVNRTLETLNGVTEVEVSEGGTLLTATTILGLNEPSYEWSSSDETQITIEAIAGTNQAIATRVGPVGGTAMITVTDVGNSLSRSVNGSLVVPNEEAPSTSGFALRSVYPNPAHTQADVVFEIGAPAHVRVALYDVLGRRVAVALDAEVPAGERTATLQLESLAAGVYVLFVEAEGVVETRQLTVVR